MKGSYEFSISYTLVSMVELMEFFIMLQHSTFICPQKLVTNFLYTTSFPLFLNFFSFFYVLHLTHVHLNSNLPSTKTKSFFSTSLTIQRNPNPPHQPHYFPHPSLLQLVFIPHLRLRMSFFCCCFQDFKATLKVYAVRKTIKYLEFFC